MTDPSTDTTTARRPKARRHIEIDGETLIPRTEFAEYLGISEKTAQRMNLPTTYIGNVAYVAKNASLRVVAERVQRRNQPAEGRRRSRTAR
jgi:hypothetical protein